MNIECYKCNTVLKSENLNNISRSEECPNCYANIRCCRMCKFYDLTAYNECREPTADRIVEKEKANFCDHFQIGSDQGGKDDKDDHLAAANALFK